MRHRDVHFLRSFVSFLVLFFSTLAQASDGGALAPKSLLLPTVAVQAAEREFVQVELSRRPELSFVSYARLDADLLARQARVESFSIDLKNNVYDFVVKRHSSHRGYERVSAVGQKGARLSLVAKGEWIHGWFRIEGNNFQLTSITPSLVAIYQADFSVLQEHPIGGMSRDFDALPLFLLGQRSQSVSPNVEPDFPSQDDVINALVVYTNDAAATVTGLEQLIELAVFETNQSYEDGASSARLNLVHVENVDLNESGDMAHDLSLLMGNGDGVADQVHQLRQDHGADIVMLITSNDYWYCGLAADILAKPETAFAVVRSGCATGNYSFAHEVGHLHGARHNIEMDPNLEPFAYGHGYCSSGTNPWRTIMATSCPTGSATRILRWSTPLQSHRGKALGEAGLSDNLRVSNDTAIHLANLISPSVEWVIEYDWGCDGRSGFSNWQLQGSGVIQSVSFGGRGYWLKNASGVEMKFDNGTRYIGTLGDGVLGGEMYSAVGSAGCWSLSQSRGEVSKERRDDLGLRIRGKI